MSKRAMEEQGGGERYGFSEMDNSGSGERAFKATAAQMARRNIAPLKRRPGSGKSSRQASPAITTGVPQTQSFVPPTGSFNFSFGNSDNTPTFGAQPQQNGTPSFNFGASQPDPNQQNGGSMTANNQPLFSGAGFGSQQGVNGFGATNSSAFGQTNNAAAASPAQFSFGQSQPTPQTNGTSFGGFGQTNGGSTNNSNFSFGGQPEKPKESTPSFSFGGQPPQSKENTPSFSFGGQPPQSKESTPSFAFAAQPEQPKASNSPFNFGSTNANETPKPPASGFSFGVSKPEQHQTQPAPSFAGFGQSTSDQVNKTNTGPFGATPPPSATASNGASVFDSVKQPNGIKPGMFTASADQTPKATTPFNFAPQTEKKDTDKTVGFSLGDQTSSTAETPKPANNFFNFGPSTNASEQTPKPANSFGGFGQSQAEAPKTANIFAMSTNQAGTTSKPGSSLNEDASMTTPESTPRQANTQSQAKPPGTTFTSAPSETPAKKSLFERMTPADPPATAQKLNLGSSMFDKAKTTGETPKAPSKGLFERIEAPSTTPKQSTSMFSAPTSSAAASKLQPSTAASSAASQAPSRPTIQYSSRTPTAKDWVKLENLNNALLGHLNASDTDVDWSPAFAFYMQEAAKLMGKEAYAQFAPRTMSAAPSTPSAPVAAPLASITTAAPLNKTSNFSTPKPPAHGSLLRHVDPPATAPVNKKRLADDDAQPPPATEKRARPDESSQYPTLPDTASKTAKLFASTLDKATNVNKAKAAAGSGSSTSLFASSASTAQQHKSSAATNNTSSGGFKPTGFAAPPADGFFSSFGKQAAENEEKEKKKRKQEDFDSEDDDEAEWEAKDKAARDEKKRKIEEAAKSASGFVFKPSTGTSASSSVFSFGDKDAAKDKTLGEKVQGTGDHTWKPETPIKFGASTNGLSSTTPAAPPPVNPFGGLFGSNQTPKPDTAKLAPPSVGFNFGATKAASVDTSRATTPGVTTDGETSNAGENGPSDEQNDEQVGDMTSLMPEESDGQDVLFETQMARAVKLEQKKALETQSNGEVVETSKLKASWAEKGRGPLYVLRDVVTGKTRVLLKVPPLGRAAMNFAMLGVESKMAPGKAKVVQCTFIDHTGSDEEKAGKPSTWTIQFREASEANEFVKIVNDNRP